MANEMYLATCEALGVAVQMRKPVILWGDPGQGKSNVLAALAESQGRHIEILIPSASEPTDFSGLPEIVDTQLGDTTIKQTVPIPPGWALRLRKTGGTGIGFFDELSNAPDALQAVAMNVILTRIVGELYMGDGVSMVCAANPTIQAANGWELALPLKNRLIHLDWTLPADVFAEGLMGNWPEVPVFKVNDDEVAQGIAQGKILVASFLRTRTDYVTRTPANNTADVRGYPTPRSWETAAELYGFCEAVGASRQAQRLLLIGTIGSDAAAEFFTYVDALDLPDSESLLENPTGWKVPKRGDQLFAIAMSVVKAVENNYTPDRWQAATQVSTNIIKAGHADIAVVMVTKLFRLEEYQNSTKKVLPAKEVLTILTPILKEANLI